MRPSAGSSARFKMGHCTMHGLGEPMAHQHQLVDATPPEIGRDNIKC